MLEDRKETGNNSAIEVFKTFLKLGFTSFGGPIAHLGYFHKELVARQQWVTEHQFSQLLAICQFLPGPASSQLGFALGLIRAGWLGAIAAFAAFTLPSALILVIFASLLPFFSGDIGTAAIHGLKIVAFAVVADALLGMWKNLCSDTPKRSIAILSAAILLVLDSAWFQVIVITGGAILGMAFCRQAVSTNETVIPLQYGKRISGVLLFLFLLLLVGLPITSSNQVDLLAIADAFYRAGALVFGGGHVVLPLLQDATVATGWISEETFLAGYGVSQAIPGPMFAFSAYLGTAIPSAQSSWLTSTVALVFIFLPGFMLVTAALPIWQRISHNPMARNAIVGVNAAVVGLLGSALYDPIFTSGITSGTDMAIGAVALGMLAIWKISPLYAVVWCVIASILVSLF